jgi:hypothetical protein
VCVSGGGAWERRGPSWSAWNLIVFVDFFVRRGGCTSLLVSITPPVLFRRVPGASVEPYTLHITHLVSLESKTRFTVVLPKNTTYIGLRVRVAGADPSRAWWCCSSLGQPRQVPTSSTFTSYSMPWVRMQWSCCCLSPCGGQDKVASLSGLPAASVDLYTVSTGARLRATKIEKKQAHGVYVCRECCWRPRVCEV